MLTTSNAYTKPSCETQASIQTLKAARMRKSLCHASEQRPHGNPHEPALQKRPRTGLMIQTILDIPLLIPCCIKNGVSRASPTLHPNVVTADKRLGPTSARTEGLNQVATSGAAVAEEASLRRWVADMPGRGRPALDSHRNRCLLMPAGAALPDTPG